MYPGRRKETEQTPSLVLCSGAFEASNSSEASAPFSAGPACVSPVSPFSWRGEAGSDSMRGTMGSTVPKNARTCYPNHSTRRPSGRADGCTRRKGLAEGHLGPWLGARDTPRARQQPRNFNTTWFRLPPGRIPDAESSGERLRDSPESPGRSGMPLSVCVRVDD